MKQKIVIQVSMPCEKSRSKAMELVARANGVSSVGVTGDSKDRLEVVGDGVDSVCLVSCLRKKIGHASILQVEEVKDKKPEEKKKPEEPKIEYWYPGYSYPLHHHHNPHEPWWWQWRGIKLGCYRKELARPNRWHGEENIRLAMVPDLTYLGIRADHLLRLDSHFLSWGDKANQHHLIHDEI
ncbi:hypothetical protein EJB05_39184 [Eragrostis curvula]|uniref:HMA domain-containing protein n=1 Tax=Eragrostis curvula TaxID=38414 RepID=A0A5J9TW77_9POAL|nr:hypothetical protein EJB05_39184 [Eragrostis curvula]